MCLVKSVQQELYVFKRKNNQIEKALLLPVNVRPIASKTGKYETEAIRNQPILQYKHSIAVGVEAVLLFDGVFVSS